MRVEFRREVDQAKVVGVARWDGKRATMESDDPSVRDTLERIFRPTPVVVDDPSLRPLGSRGESLVYPGSLEWFREAALSRAGSVGLRARFVPEVRGHSGWDPASAYRTFGETVDRLVEGQGVRSG